MSDESVAAVAQAHRRARVSDEVVAAVAQAHRRDWARVLAATARLTRDLDLAEDSTQDAYAQALQTWPKTGIPDRPAAWLTTTARNRALDVLRRESVQRRALPLLVTAEATAGPEDELLSDERLPLIFTCCHPALSREAQVALTLRLVCGLSTAEVARAFLVQEPTMAARITRAKKKIAAARIPYRVPSPDQLAERVGAVLEVVHLIFTTGHTAPIGANLIRRDLVDSAVRLARMLHLLMPNDAEISALLALLLLIDARASTRLSAGGRMLLLSEQDRTRWDAALISEGVALLTDALRRKTSDAVRRGGRHRRSARRGAELAGHRLVGDRRPVRRTARSLALIPGAVELNRAAAIGLRDGPAAGLDALAPLLSDPALATYGSSERRPSRLPAPTAPVVRGRRGLRRGSGSDRQRRGASLPHRPPRRRPSPPTDLTRVFQRRSVESWWAAKAALVPRKGHHNSKIAAAGRASGQRTGRRSGGLLLSSLV